MKVRILALAAAAWAAAWAVNWDAALIRGTTPNGKMFYAPGEEMVFSLVLEGAKGEIPADTYFLDWERRGDDGLTEKGRAPLPVKAPFVLRTKSDRPGFVCVEANVVTKDGARVPKNHRWEKRVFFMGGAGVAPHEVRGGREPADYDAFWNSLEARLAAVPVTAERRELPCPDKAVRLYAVKIACAGPRPVTGYLTIPASASATNRMPIEACYRGASYSEMEVPTGGPHDRIRMTVNVNGYDLGRGEAYIKDFFKSISKPGYGYGMDPESNADREKSYWKDVALRAIRYLQWITTLPEWDGRTLALSAGSQGGWQALMAAARFRKVTRLVTNGTWGCDWTGQDTLGRLKSTYRPACTAPAMAYFDPVFAARRLTCPVAITFAGMGDYVSPPSSLTALYNALPVPKKITYVQGSTHGWRPQGEQKVMFDGGFDRAVAAQAVLVDPVAYITNALAAGARRVVLPKAAYWLTPARGETAYLALRGVKDATIDFNGSTFIGTVKTRMIDLRDCARVTLRNLTIDYADLPFTQAVITRVDAEGTWDVKVIDGYPVPERGEKGDGACWPIQVYGKEDGELKNPMRFRDGIEIAKTGVDTFRISGGRDRRGDVGDVAVWSVKETGRATDVSAIKSLRCSECRFEDIVEYATPHGCAYEDYFGDANTYLRCQIVRCPPEKDLFPRGMKRLRSGNHDANMHRGAVRGPRILDCTAKYHCDDCVNISGMYGLVTASTGTNELRILVNYLGLSIDDGDTCQVMTYEGRSLPDVTVVKVTPDGDATEEEKAYLLTLGLWPGLEKTCRRAYRLTLARPLALARGSVIISNRHQGNGFVVRGCDFGHTRARGLLIKASGGLVESNRIARCASLAVQIATEYQWMEGGCSRDLVVRGNTCRRNGGGVYVGGNNGARRPLPPDSHYDISITDNEVDGGDIAVEGCTGGEVRRNGAAKVTLRNCVGVARDRPGADALTPARLGDARARGFVGALQDRLLARRVFSDAAKEEIWKEARDAFAHPDDDVFNGGVGMWKGEFWGKLMISACRVAEHTGDAALKAFLREEGLRLVAFQRPDGYLGTYTKPDNVLPLPLDEARRRVGWPCPWNWNLWCRKYTLWGLLACWRLTGERALLDAADRAMANQIATLRRLGLKLCDTGTSTMRGLPPCSILKPLLWLYEDTGKAAYLDEAREIVGFFSDGRSRAPQFAAKLDAGLPLDAWYPEETGRWGKAYEMMSLLDGFVEFYRATGDRSALAVAERMQALIRAGESNLCGSVGYNDQFTTARRALNGVSEPCDAVHWMRLNLDLYLVTGEARYADAVEETLYNAFLASVRPDGAWGARCVRSHGRHQPAPPQSGMTRQHCCVNNLPRGFMDAAQTVLARDAAGALSVALYHDAAARMGADAVEIAGNYPVGDRVTVRVTRAAPGKVRFRVPAWCAKLAIAGPGVARDVRTPGWAEVAAPAGVSTWTLAFDMAPRPVWSCRPATDAVAAADERRRRWCDMKTEADLQGLFVTKPYAQVRRGPLLLARSVRLGAAPEALVPAASVNDGLQAKGPWTLAAERIDAPGVWGAWRLVFRRGEETVAADVCDYPSADTWRAGANAFSTLF